MQIDWSVSFSQCINLNHLYDIYAFKLKSHLFFPFQGHINAAHLSGYVGLNSVGHGGPYHKNQFFDNYNGKFQLLTSQEMKLLEHTNMEKSGLYMKELATWCQLDVATARKAGHIDRIQEIEFNSRILQFRASMDGIYDYTSQPPHFFYIHFLVLLSAIYLPLFAIDTAISAGWGNEKYVGLDMMNFIIVFLQCIFVVGLRALGVHMIVRRLFLCFFLAEVVVTTFTLPSSFLPYEGSIR